MANNIFAPIRCRWPYIPCSALVVGFHFLIMLGLTVAVTLFFQGYPEPAALLTLIPSMVLCFLFAWSLGVLFGFANVYFPDTQQMVTVALQLLYFLSGVFYPIKQIKMPLAKEIIRYNPLCAFVDIIRDPLVGCQFPSASTFAYATVVTIASLCAAVWMLHSRERTLIFHM